MCLNSSSCALAVTECILLQLRSTQCGLTSLGNDELQSFVLQFLTSHSFTSFSLCLFPVSTFHYYSCFVLSHFISLSFFPPKQCYTLFTFVTITVMFAFG